MQTLKLIAAIIVLMLTSIVRAADASGDTFVLMSSSFVELGNMTSENVSLDACTLDDEGGIAISSDFAFAGGFTGSLFDPLELRIVSIHSDSDQISLQWEGGIGPFRVERTPSLATGGLWEPVAVHLETRSGNIPNSGETAYYRVAAE